MASRAFCSYSRTTTTFLLVEALIFLLFSLLSQLLRVETFSLFEHFSHSLDFSSFQHGPAEVDGLEEDEDVEVESSGSRISSCIGSSSASGLGADCAAVSWLAICAT